MNRNACTALTASALALAALATGPLASLADAVYTVPATSNPWLAGQNSGASVTAYFGGTAYTDTAPATSPAMAGSFAPGSMLNFAVSGGAANGPTHPLCGPDGHTISKPEFFGWPAFDIANVHAPLNSLVGVFLGEEAPTEGGISPDPMDFRDPGSIDFATLTPELKQVFFIGDGLRADGLTAQNFVVPEGATRLFLAVMDGYQWSNNVGGFNVAVRQVPAPGAAAGLVVAGAGLAARRRRRSV